MFNVDQQETQEHVCLTKLGTQICPANEVRNFLDNIPFERVPLWEIITCWECGLIGTVEAFGALETNGLLKGPDELMRAFCIANRVEAGMPLTTPPEPPEPVSGAIRPEPSELVRVTATARQMRGAA